MTLTKNTSIQRSLSSNAFLSRPHLLKLVNLTLRRTAGASARVLEPEGLFHPFPHFSLCSQPLLSSFARYARSSRLGLTESSGGFSRE